MIRVLIAIPLYYREEAGFNCIMSLLKTTVVPPNVSVQVVAGINLVNQEFKDVLNSLDKVHNGIRFDVIDYGKNVGKPAVVNDIASKYEFDYLMSLDGDMVCVNPRWLAGMLGVYTEYNKDQIVSNVNGKRFSVPMGSLCVNQLGSNCHVLLDGTPGLITRQIGPLTLMTRFGCGLIAGGGLMTDRDTWKSIGGYSTKTVYGGDDGYYHTMCHDKRKLSAYIKEISFYHPFELNRKYQEWKIRACKSFIGVEGGLDESETEGFRFENT